MNWTETNKQKEKELEDKNWEDALEELEIEKC